jgi:two-component system sensor histidine kinase UhpB
MYNTRENHLTQKCSTMVKQFFLPVIIFYLLILSHPSVAQPQRKIDSLVNLLSSTKQDTNRVRILTQLYLSYALIGNYDKSAPYGKELKELCDQLLANPGDSAVNKRTILGLADYYLYSGFINRVQGNYEAAVNNQKEAYKIGEKIGNKRLMGTTLTQIGIIYILQSNYTEALNSFLKAKNIVEETGDKRSLGDVYMSIGSAYSNQGNYPEAIKNYFAALKNFEEINYKQGIGSCYINIGSIFSEQNDLSEAMKNYSAALKIWEELSNKKELGNVYLNIGSIKQKKNNLSEALKDYLTALKISGEINDPYTQSLARLNIGEVYALQKNYTESIKYYLLSIKYMEETHSNQLATAYGNIASVYTQMENFAEAILYYNKAVALAKKTGANDDLKDIYLGYSEMYLKTKDYKNAYENHKLYSDEKDSILNETNTKQIAEIKTKYETEKKDQEILLLNKNKQIQDLEIKKQTTLKYSFIAGLAVLLILSFLVYRNYRTRKLLELQALRNKIAHDLHDDIGSTLNSISIYSEVAKNKSKENIPELDLIGESSRKVMDAMSDIVWTINPDNDSFEKIIFRMRSLTHLLMKAKNLEYQFKADEKLNDLELPMQTRKNFYLIFKEAINNLLKYSNATRVAISLNYPDNVIEMFIRDNGVGFDVANPPRGNGLASMKQRADKIKARFNIESSTGNGTSVELYLKT